MAKYIFHSFFCPVCGQKMMDLPRKQGHKHKDFHRKKLYCPWCQREVNCIEIKDIMQEMTFKENFAKGIYKDEASNTVHSGGNSGIG